MLANSGIAIALLLAWVVPNHYPPFLNFYNELAAWISLCILLKFYQPIKPFTFSPLVIVVALIGLVPIFQYFVGIVFFSGDALLASLYLFGFAFAIVIGRDLAYRPNFVDGMAALILMGAYVSFILATCQWSGVDSLGIWLVDLPVGGRPYANMAQPNNLAVFLCMGLASAIYLRERGAFGKWLLAIFAVLLFSGVAMTRSRMALVVVLVMALWMFYGRHLLQLKCRAFEVVFGLALFFTLWLFWPFISEMLYLPAESSWVRLEGALVGDVRLLLWQQLLDAAFKQPWIGYGWNQVAVAQVMIAAEYPQSLMTEHAHNLLVDILVWNGAFIGAAIIGWIGWWVVKNIRCLNNLQAWFSLLVIFVLGTHSMFEFPLEYFYFLLPFGLFVGVVDSVLNGHSFCMSREVFRAVSAVGFLILAWMFVEYQTVEEDYRRLRFESAGIEQRQDSRFLPSTVLLTQLSEYIRFARTEAREGMGDNELEWMRQVSMRYPYFPAMSRYALALGMNGRYDEASLQLLKLKQLHSEMRYVEVKKEWERLQVRYPYLINVSLP